MKTIYTLLVVFFVAQCGIAQDFQNVASSLGVDEGCGSCSLGCGLSFADFDGDGWDDLTFATQLGDSIHFYKNNNGTGFTKLAALVPHDDKSEQVVWIDFDNDGDRDLFVTSFGGSNRLYENDGSLNLTDITAAAGLPTGIDDPSYGAVFGDYNNDGWLDLYVANWSFPPTYGNYLFSNNGDGTFSDMTTYAGVKDDYELTFCSAFLDINGNGWQDLYNSQDRDQSPNSMFKNNGDSTFLDISVSSETDLEIDAMDVGVGDFDNDGDLDIYVTNTPSDGGSSLLRNNGDETFTDVVDDYGVGFITRVGWGGNFFDCENDGDLDLYVCGMHNGSNNGSALFINHIETDTFIEIEPPNMAGDTLNSFANAMADFNQDGLVDIAVNNATSAGVANKFHVWENMDASNFNWIKVNLEGVEANKEGIGSWIEVWREGNKYVRYTHCGLGYLSQHSTTETIGVGTSTVIDTLIVKWLGGNINKMYNLTVNETYNILENTVPLDVELINFSAKATDRFSVNLNWVTATEEMNKGFHLQRSKDGTHFNNIKWIDGKGTTGDKQYYIYEDVNVEKGNTYYYRLRQLDYDASIANSKIISVYLQSKENEIGNFYPNPPQGNMVSLNISSDIEQVFNMVLYDMKGVLVSNRKITIPSGSNTFQLELNDNWSGLYLARISMGSEVYFRKLLIPVH